MAQRSEALNFSVLGKLWQLNWSLILLLLIVSGAGLGMLYSAAGGSWEPWASRQAIRLALGMVLMIVIALVSIRVWLKFAYFFYAGALALLASVEVFGAVRMGAQRWIDLKFMHLQPSEIMKFALVLALARCFYSLHLSDVG
ncbi:MAG: FtsW/RodA/SpoVE family cell cycle protein, partial [Alphaproteobacteria bacterium]